MPEEPKPKMMRGGPDPEDREDSILMQEKSWVIKKLFRDDGMVRPSLLWKFHEEIEALKLTMQAMVGRLEELTVLLQKDREWREKQAGEKPARGWLRGGKPEPDE